MTGCPGTAEVDSDALMSGLICALPDETTDEPWVVTSGSVSHSPLRCHGTAGSFILVDRISSLQSSVSTRAPSFRVTLAGQPCWNVPGWLFSPTRVVTSASTQ